MTNSNGTATADNAIRCPKCTTGYLNPIEDGYSSCLNCGYEMPIPEPPKARTTRGKAQGVTVTVTLHPGNLQALFAALASTKGQTPADFLVSYGLTKGRAKAMTGGTMIDVQATLKIAKDFGIGPEDLFTLMERSG